MRYIISDVHGCIFTLDKLIKRVHEIDTDAEFVFVGDYFDRGLHSKEVVNEVIALQKDGAICLRGNHDDVIDWMIHGECESDLSDKIDLVEPWSVAMWWMQNGFHETLNSYKIKKEFCGADAVYELKNRMPQKHKKFLRKLPLYWENETHFACHAYLDPSMELPRELRFLSSELNTSTLWSRFPQLRSVPVCGTAIGLDTSFDTSWDKIGVFGHTPVQVYNAAAPIRHQNLRLIDGGAFQDEYLVAYCCERDDWILQATDSRDIKS